MPAVVIQVNDDLFPALAGGCVSVQTTKIPDIIQNRGTFQVAGRPTVDARAKEPVADQKQTHLANSVP